MKAKNGHVHKGLYAIKKEEKDLYREVRTAMSLGQSWGQLPPVSAPSHTLLPQHPDSFIPLARADHWKMISLRDKPSGRAWH
jgi:hypothetical protein